MNGYIPLHHTPADNPVLLINPHAPLVDLLACADQRIRALHKLMNSLSCMTAQTADASDLFQIADSRIQKIDPATGRVLNTLPAPGGGNDSGMAWAEGSLWIGQYRERKIYQVDPETGEVLRTLTSDRFVTGVTWVDGEFWHGTWEGEESEIRRIDPQTAEVLETLRMPAGIGVSGLESDGGERFFCGGGNSGKVRVVRRR